MDSSDISSSFYKAKKQGDVTATFSNNHNHNHNNCLATSSELVSEQWVSILQAAS
jgi:hypothetical protein